MIPRPLGTDTSNVDEPVPAHEAPGAGSTSSGDGPSMPADLGRALVCVLLVAATVGSPGSAPLLAPFVPGLVALRILRSRRGAARFLAITAFGSTAAAVAAAGSGLGASLVGAAAALVLVCGLGCAHVLAARPDPPLTLLGPAPAEDDWPEPRIDTGFSLALGAWTVGLLAILAAVSILAASGSAGILDGARSVVADAYAPYERACTTDGALADQDDLCRRLLDQRDAAITLVADHGIELAATLFAVFAWGGAATTHSLVLARHRRLTGAGARPVRRLRELEVHWSAPYVLILGLVALMSRRVLGGIADDTALAVGAGLSALGALLVLQQGVGLVAWLFTRRPTPVWYRVLLAIAALVAASVTIVATFVLGVLDLAARPRRRGSASGSLPGRGSGS